MKIGIFTFPLQTNYGGILQAYALQKALNAMGHEAWLIDREKKFITQKEIVKILIRVIKKYIFRQKGVVIFLGHKRKREFLITSINTQKFIKENIKPTLKVKRVNDIPIDFFDAIVVGSDQIWRPLYNNKIENSFLSFTKNWRSLKRISYAASFGTSNWEYNKSQTKKCKYFIKKFNAVSVRESSGVNLCKQYFDVEAQQVLDPTMLLDLSEYMKIIESYSKNVEGELFVYVLDKNDEKQRLIDTISDEYGHTPFYASTDNQKADLDIRITTPVEEWIKSFYSAKFIITDSFHGCIFSILFNKPFIACGNIKRGLSRFESLLKLFDLEDRLITSVSELTEEKIFVEIDWKKTNRILEKQRQNSLNFLNIALHGDAKN